MSEQIKSKFLGDFGEYLLTWHLRSKFGITASLVKTEGIDLLYRDEEGKVFPEGKKGKVIAVSIKTRERRKDLARKYVNVDWDKIDEASKRWDAIPYFAYVRIVPDNGRITFFLLPVDIARKYSQNFSVAKAENDKESNVLFEMQFTGYERRENW